MPAQLNPSGLPLGRGARALAAGVVGFAALASAWYVLAGRTLILEAAAANRRAVLRNLLAGPGPFAPQDYLAAGDRLAVALGLAAFAVACVIALAPVAYRPLGRMYDRWQRSPLGRWRALWPLAVLALVAVVLVWLAVGVLDAFPNSGDEACYLYQAETFASGRIVNTPHALQPFFTANHIRAAGGRLFSVFPPGWPAVLVLALETGVPSWVVNPFLGLGLLAMAFVLARRQHGARVAVASTVILAVSPFFLFNAASYFSHTLCTLAILTYAYCGHRALDERRLSWAAAAAASLGIAALTRNYTAALCAVPFAVALVRRGRFGWQALAVCVVAGLPFVATTLAYNAATMGSPLTMAQYEGASYTRLWFPDGWLGRATEITSAHLGRFLLWTPPALLGIWTWACVTGRLAARSFSDYLFPVLVAGYFIYVDRGGNQYGPRFYHEAFPFVVIAVAAVLFRESRYEDKSRGGRWAFHLMAASVVACLPLLALHARDQARVVFDRAEPFRMAEQRALRRAVVFLATGSGWTRPMAPADLTRNDPDFDDAVLFVHDRGAENARLMARYPGWSFWRYRVDPRSHAGVLEPLGRTRR